MSRRKQSNPKPVKRDDELPGMDDESLNGGDTKSSALSMEEEEELEEDGVSLTTTSSSAAATPPPPPPPQQQQPPLPSARVRTSSRASEEADQSAHKLPAAGPKMGPTPPPLQTIAVKRRRELEPDELIIIPSASRPSPPATAAAAAAAVQPPHPPSLPTQHPLLSADLLHSLQYFALLRQSLPNGSLMNLPVAPPPPPPPPIPSRLSPTPPASSKSSAGLNHMCPSCGICFSSASTLGAHATYYCSKRPQVTTAVASAPVTNESPLPGLPTQTEMMANVPLSNGRSQTPEQMDELLNDRPSAPKIRRSGRYYACPYCSFSADKRVSLNRHMRVHVGLPLLATHPVSPPPPPLPAVHLEPTRSLSSDRPTAGSSPEFRMVNKFQDEPGANRAGADSGADRFCADCKIQFSSFKTYQVHKQHYCQSRKSSLSAGSPVPVLEKTLPSAEAAGRVQNAGGSPMTILMLPTHPPIVIPLCILQSARILTADQPMPPHSVIVSPHGDIQFRADSPEDPRSTVSSVVVTPAASTAPTTPATVSAAPAPVIPAISVTPVPSAPPPAEPPAAANSNSTIPPEMALDLSSKASESEPAATTEASSKESTSSATGGIRIREELAHVNQSSPDANASQQPQNPALPFLPPKVFAELEALGMCLGVPSGHDMTSNPAQWLAMLENAVLQAQRPSSAIPCEECNISFRRMESYLVHKQYYCAARHQTQSGQPGNKELPPAPAAAEQVNGNQAEETAAAAAAAAPVIHRDPVIQRANKHACPLCGIEFESAVVLQAHRNYYCLKREVDPALKNAADARKANQESLTASPNASGPSPSNNAGASPTAGGSGPIQPQGWKCPCCDVVSPTAASAQKHMETHSNVRAFRCSVCGYRGNTLRGMRTHVRIHFDRRNADLCEDNYISCIMGGTGAVGEFNPAAGGMPNSPPDVDQIFKSLGIPPEVCAKVLSAAHPQSADASVGNSRDRRELGGSSLAGLQFLQLAQRIANHSPGPTTGAGCRSDKLFLCDLCCYSSSYRGNVIRHSKLVHGREISEVAVVSSNFLQQAVNNNPAAMAKTPFSDPNMAGNRTKTMTDHSPPPRPALTSTPSSLPNSRMMSTGSPDEAIQVKIDPDDVMMMHQSSTGGSNSSHSGEGHSPPLNNLTSDFHSGTAGAATGTDPFRKHCKSCNITFTYMNTFLAHKKYYCSSQAPLEDQEDRDHDRDENMDDMDDEDEELEAGNSASPPPAPNHHSEATPT
ncbi:zinc finger protein ush-like isoform X4 [Daphnia pulex]|uniref:zinc finger protein ush-like isoform X4 n=1 Tax=Daphnia pulex TaxID=6669 RepID=UPI001EDF42B4|nr:zinc finger protein ush-like isoform X4 [Daphnia pulex]XP_046449684.1 zinc finger protein ush-like isoform X4 [Daphnia pulex]